MAWNLTAPGAGLRQGAGCADGDEPQAQRAAAIGVGEALAWAKGALEAVTLVVEGEVSQFKDNPSYKAAYAFQQGTNQALVNILSSCSCTVHLHCF